jgi:hypothetical protein
MSTKGSSELSLAYEETKGSGRVSRQATSQPLASVHGMKFLWELSGVGLSIALASIAPTPGFQGLLQALHFFFFFLIW